MLFMNLILYQTELISELTRELHTVYRAYFHMRMINVHYLWQWNTKAYLTPYPAAAHDSVPIKILTAWFPNINFVIILHLQLLFRVVAS
jgi:hypothetical protein